jgi:Protein of unknown function (DUF2911)
MTARRTISLLASLVLVTPSVAAAQSRVLIARLGTDTLSIEKFTRSGNTITGKYLMHSPSTLLIGFTLMMRPDGTVASMEQTIADGRGQPVPGQPTAARMRFAGDTVFRSMTVNGQAVESKLAVPAGTFPALGRPWLLMELGIHAAHHAGTSIYYTINAAPQATQPNTWPLRFVRPDSIEVTYSPAPLVVRLDAKGEILRIDGIRSTLKAVVTPAADADIDAIGARWATADAAGQAMGAPSSRDTARARVGAAALMVDYGRPLRRGRAIWGTVVPYDSVWRLGANAATQFTTDRALEIAGRPLAAGTYSLWMIPSATGGTLIVNRQTKQWGTQYDPAQDLLRLPVTRSASSASVERFTVSIDADAMRFAWDDAVYAVTLRVP